MLTRAAAVVYLKNRVSKGWSPAEEYSQAKPIPEEEKASFRDRIVPVLVASPPQIRLQLIPTLQKILAYDFPAKWPNFLDITIQLLNAGDIASVFAGVQCLLAICKIYRFKSGENRADFDRIVALSFPQLLNIGNSLAGETSLEAGEILRTVLKVYKHAIYVSRFWSPRRARRTDCFAVRPPRFSSRTADHGWLVHTVFDRRRKGAPGDLHDRGPRRARDQPLVEGEEVVIRKLEPSLR